MADLLSALGWQILFIGIAFIVGIVCGYVFKGSIKKEIKDLLDEANNAIDDSQKELKEKIEMAKKNL